MKNIYLLIISLFFNSFSLFAQTKEVKLNDQPVEKICFTTDRNLYITGEDVWFEAYCILNNKFKNKSISKVLNVEIYNSNGKSIIQKKYKLSNGKSFGKINIPKDLSSGYYVIVAYTKYLQNFNSSFMPNVCLTIANPNYSMPGFNIGMHEIYNKSNTDSVNIVNKKKDRIIYEQVNLTTDKTIYNQREKISVHIPSLTKQINNKIFLSVSVVKKGTNLSKFSIGNNPSTNSSKELSGLRSYLPENRAVNLSGVIKNKASGDKLTSLKVYAAVYGNSNELHISDTKEDGSFIFTFHSLSEINNIYLCTNSLNTGNIELLINNDLLNTYNINVADALIINKSHNQLLDDLLLNLKIEDAYQPQKINLIKPFIKETGYQFGIPEVSVKIEDFIKFPTLHEIFNEIIPTVLIEERKGAYKFLIFNREGDEVYENPLVLLDNIPIFDNSLILRIKPKFIDQIDVINKSYILGDQILNGIISIKTKTNNFASIKFPVDSKHIKYTGISAGLIPEYPEYNTSELLNSRTPDYRNLLYFNPNIILSNKNDISFYASDATGEYDIIVKGLSNEGEFYYGSIPITIK